MALRQARLSTRVSALTHKSLKKQDVSSVCSKMYENRLF